MSITKETDSQQVEPSPEKKNNTRAILLLSILAFVLGLFAFLKVFLLARSPNQVYVVDTDRLASSYLHYALTTSSSSAGMKQKQTYNKINELNQYINDIGASGVVLLRKSAVVSYPAAVDITNEVAEQLKITLLPEEINSVPKLPSNSGNLLNADTKQQETLPTENNQLGSHLD